MRTYVELPHDPASAPHPRRSSVLTICGSGNAGHALTVVASQNFDGDIDWLVGSERRAEMLHRAVSGDCLKSTGVITAGAERVRTISADPAQVIPNADIVMIVVPAFAHAAVLHRIRPYVRDTTTIGCLPTRSGFEFEAAQLLTGSNGSGRRIFGLQTLPWSTRVVTPGKIVNIGAVKAEVVLAARPAAASADIAARLANILGTRLVPTDGFLNLTLGNPGQYIHTGLMYGQFHSWRGEEYDHDRIPMLYADATDETGAFVEQLSADGLAVARELEARAEGALNLRSVVPVHDWLRSSYSRSTGDTSTVATCLRTGPIRMRQAPMTTLVNGRFVPNFGYRYLSEDVPFGLVITRALADIAEVATPAIDELIYWAQSVMQKLYLVGGKLEGPATKDLPIPQRRGVLGVTDLIDWYTDDASEVSVQSRTA
jgi:NAD/NADP octopine/nopaline dehydrogenase, alpha-helical domain